MSFELILPFLRPIELLLLDESISEIMGNPDASWWYERDGIIYAKRLLPSLPVDSELRDPHRTLLRPCAGDCPDDAEDDCPEKDYLIQQLQGEQMPLLEINLTRHISASIRPDETTAEQVDQYAAFVHATADDVVDKALNYVFSKDRDFLDFLKTPQAREIAPTLRVRGSPNKDAKHEAEQPAKKLEAGVESTAAMRVMKA